MEGTKAPTTEASPLTCMLEAVTHSLPIDAPLACTILASLVDSASGLLLSRHAVDIRNVVVRVHPLHSRVQTLAMQLVRRLRSPDKLLFADDLLAILLHPLLHSRASIKAALAVFKKANFPMAHVFKPHPMLFVNLALLFDNRNDESMVVRVFTAATLLCHRKNNRTNLSVAEVHKDFFTSLFHKSDALRRAVFMYLATASSKKTRKLPENDTLLGALTVFVTTADIEFMREHGLEPVKRLCSLIAENKNHSTIVSPSSNASPSIIA